MLHQLDTLTIHAFRGLRDLELPGLGRVNLLVGQNNSGKTSVLEAIATYCRPVDPLEWLKAVRRREIKSSRQPLTEGLHWMFPHGNLPPGEDGLFYGKTRISGEGRFAAKEALAECEQMVSYETSNGEEEEEESSGSSSEYPDSASGDESVTELRLTARVPSNRWLEFDADADTGLLRRDFELWEERPFKVPSQVGMSPPALPVATVSPFAHRVEPVQVKQLTSLTLGDRRDQLLTVLRMFDASIEDLEILSREGVRAAIYIKHKRLGRAPLSSFGDGMRRALTIALSLVNVQAGVLLIDEIEGAMHISALQSVFSWLVNTCAVLDVQLFATTHSLEAVDAILTSMDLDPNQVVGYQLASHEDRIQVRRFSGELLHGLRFERGLDVR